MHERKWIGKLTLQKHTMSGINSIKKLPFTIAFFLFQILSYSQPLRMMFVEYDKVITALQSSNSLGELKYSYDYSAVLLLDSSKIDLVKQTGFQHLEVFRNYARGLSQANDSVGFVTSLKDIKELFIDQKSSERILECTQGYERLDVEVAEFVYPIYVKGNEVVFETSGPSGSDIYFARLKNGIIQINWLGGTIE